MRLIDQEGRLLGRLNLLDGIVLFFLLFASLLAFHLIRYDFLRHSTLTIDSVEPQQFTPGTDGLISVFGNAFGPNPTLWIDNADPLASYRINETQLRIIPPADMYAGQPVISVRNQKGRVVSVQGLLEVVWKPRVESISLVEMGVHNMYLISGDYLQGNCQLEWNGKPVQGLGVRSRKEMVFTVDADDLPLTRLVLRNPSGGVTTLEGDDLLRQLRPQRLHEDWIPEIERVIPSEIRAERNPTLVIVGNAFLEGCTIRVGGQTIPDATAVRSYLLTVPIPPHSLPFGRHSVEVTNPNGKTGSLPEGLMVQREAVAEVVLQFAGLNRDQMRLFLLSVRAGGPPDRADAPRFLRILSRRYPKGEQPGRIEVLALLPVVVASPQGDLRYSDAGVPVSIGTVIQVPVWANQTLPAQLRGAPKLVHPEESSA